VVLFDEEEKKEEIPNVKKNLFQKTFFPFFSLQKKKNLS